MTTFAVLLVGLLPTYIVRFSLFGIPTNLFEVGVWVLFLAMLCSPEARRDIVSTVTVLPKNFKMWAFVFLLAAIVSTLHSPVLRSSLGIVKGWIITPMVFGVIISVTKYKDPFIWRKVVRSLVYSGLVVSLLGISQINGSIRITSIYDVPNSLALFLVPLFILTFWVGVRIKDRFYQLASVVMLIAIVGTQSFGAIVALAGAGGIGVLLSRMSIRVVQYRKVIGIFGVILFVFLLSGRVEYLLSPLIHSNVTNSTTVRLQLWDIGIRLIKQHPILGVGLGQFESAYQRELHSLFKQEEQTGRSTFYKLVPEFVFRDPHNWIISFWLNIGLVGLVSFVVLNVIMLNEGRKRFSFLDEKSYYIQGVSLAILSMLIFGLFDTIYWKNDLSALWWILVLSIANWGVSPMNLKS
jgi:O-antigen ligase